ncbi:MAG: hypothetical protein K2N48_00940 [Muribaculaceae bacterium]|nr:hypothetical protein [Muribaculaceae bacterium]
MEITDIMTLVGAAGGMQGIVEIAKRWHSRRLEMRKEEADVTAVENHNRRQQIDWLEQRLAERDRKIDAIYAELRQEQTQRINEMHQRHEAELRLAEAEARKCLVRGCSNRIPPETDALPAPADTKQAVIIAHPPKPGRKAN